MAPPPGIAEGNDDNPPAMPIIRADVIRSSTPRNYRYCQERPDPDNMAELSLSESNAILNFLKDKAKCISLVGLSLLTLPFSLCISLLCWFAAELSPALAHREQCRQEEGFRQRTVLVTGIGMAKGLTLARAFYLCGHRVIGADFDSHQHSFLTRFHSRSFAALYRLRRPTSPDHTRKQYVADLEQIIRHEGVELWVSCSGVANAMEDALVMEELDKKTTSPRCMSIQFDLKMTALLHEKDSFMRHVQLMKLPHPETHKLFSRIDIATKLAAAVARNPGRRFILKPVNTDDFHRGNMTLLPLASDADTSAHIDRIPVGRTQPWILQQFVPGGREYCTHALVVDGLVKAFVACPSSELLMHYAPLAQDDPLALQMLEFTQRFAGGCGFEDSRITGHLSFDFMVGDVMDEEGVVIETRLYVIECNPRAHTAVVLFGQPGWEMRDMVAAYIAAIPEKDEDGDEDKRRLSDSEVSLLEKKPVVYPPPDVFPRYWVGNDIVTLVLHPLLRMLRGHLSLAAFTHGVSQFCTHVLTWKEGTFEVWDPWPYVALYHRYWPTKIMGAYFYGERWSRLNVSTTKMFACH